MAFSRPAVDSSVLTAMICSGAVSAQFIAGKATRDALYLAHLDVTDPPVDGDRHRCRLHSAGLCRFPRRFARIAPGTFVPAAFAVSAALLFGSWFLARWAPRAAAQAVYLQISGLGPMLGSGFWLIATERFDPHTARSNFGRIAGVGTITGLVAALVTERIGATLGIAAMLPLLAAINLICAWLVRRLAGPQVLTIHDKGMEIAPDLVADIAAFRAPRSGRCAVSPESGGARAAWDRRGGAGRLRVQGGGRRGVRHGATRCCDSSRCITRVSACWRSWCRVDRHPSRSKSSAWRSRQPRRRSRCWSAGSAVCLSGSRRRARRARGRIDPSRSSLFKTGYEIFFTPIAPHDKRAAKSIIDVGFDRLGDAVGGGLIRLLIMLPGTVHYTALLGVAVGCSAARRRRRAAAQPGLHPLARAQPPRPRRRTRAG